MKRHAIAIITQDIVRHGISYGLDSCMLDLEGDIESQLKNIATQKATEWWNYDKDMVVLYAQAMDIDCSDIKSNSPDYVIYILDFPNWIMDNCFAPKQASDWFDGYARLALCNHLTNNLSHAATWVDDNIDAWPYFPKDKIICTCDPTISREQIQTEIDNFPKGLYAMFSCDWKVRPVSSINITDNAIAYKCGDLMERIYRDSEGEWGFYKNNEEQQ